MSNEFKFDFDWQLKTHGVPEEAASYAELSISVGGTTVTKVEDLRAKCVRNSVRVSTYHLADWLLSNWWRLMCEPERGSLDWAQSHKLTAIGGGYVWPDLSFSSDGEDVFIHMNPSFDNPSEPIRYINTVSTSLTVDQFERSIDEFVDVVSERMRISNLDRHRLTDMKEILGSERGDLETASWRKLEAILGHDPDEIPQDQIKKLLGNYDTWGEAGVDDLAGQFSDEVFAKFDDLPNLKRRAVAIDVPPLSGGDGSDCDLNSSVRSLEIGEQIAKTARQNWGLASEPIEDRKLGELLSFDHNVLDSKSSPNAVGFSAGFSKNGGGDVQVYLDTRRSTSRRFHLARILGGALVSDDRRLIPATNAKMRRQQIQRSFAQEFLCPFDSLKDFLDGRYQDDDLDEAADRFGVSPTTIKTTLVNKGVLSRGILQRV